MKLPARMPTDSVVAQIDTREVLPLDLPGLRTERATLTTGDYSVRGLTHVIALERKSLPDLLACCGRERERFDREIQRLLAYPVRSLVVEATWPDIEAGKWRSKLTTRQVGASLISWMVRGVPVVMAGNHDRAGIIVAAMLRRAAIHRWKELRTFAAEIEEPLRSRK